MYGVTIRQLRVFASVARLGSLAKASLELNLTKAAVSMALQELERQLRTPLFDRVRNRLLLNASGEQLVPLADELLERMAGIGELFADGNRFAGQLRIGASNTIGNNLLPRLLAQFMHEFSCRRPVVTIRSTAELVEQLKRFELDVALVEGRTADDELNVLPWGQDEMHVVAAPDHPLADGRRHDLESLNDQYWVLRELHSGTREQFERLLLPQLDCWYLALELNTNEAVNNSIAAGLGLGFMSRLATQSLCAAGELHEVRVSQRFPRKLSLICHRDKFRSPLLECFLDFSQAWQLRGRS
ncbi:MAG: LysR family transcriptional regulator [Oceanospirillaceae bacterium]|nr:LysR family transcriptional regulator [Oceanospirillaceae bacterium]